MNEDIAKYISEEPVDCCFDDLSGRDFWKSILGSYWNEQSMDDALDIPNVQCVLLHGPFGSGKNSLIQTMAGEMVQGGYHYLELDFSTIPKEKIRSVFKALCQDYTKNGPVFLALNHLDKLKDVRALWDYYAWANERDVSTIIAAVVEDADALMSDIRKLFHAYYIDLPDSDDRKAYFKDKLESLFENSSIQGMNKLVDGTEGFNYIQMESLAHQLKMRVKYAMLKEGKSIDIAMSWLQAEMIDEVLAKTKIPAKKTSDAMDLSGLVQVLAMVQNVQNVQNAEQVQPQEKDPLSDLRAKYNPRKVFDQGLMFVKE